MAEQPPVQRVGSLSTQLTNMHLQKQTAKENFTFQHPAKKMAVEVCGSVAHAAAQSGKFIACSNRLVSHMRPRPREGAIGIVSLPNDGSPYAGTRARASHNSVKPPIAGGDDRHGHALQLS